MCGIAGFSGTPNPSLLEQMTEVLFHRGPDDVGYYSDEGVNLGMRRLSVIDVEGGHQPVHNEDKTVWLIFNGEIYNFKELRETLIQKGHRFYTNTDSEVIVHLYEEYKKDCVHHLRGMFAFALWDKTNQQLLIARDRLGIKPLYYAFSNGSLRFASEIKSLLKDRKIETEIDPQSLFSFLTFLYIPSPGTIFKGISKLPPGHRLVLRRGKFTIDSYWDLSFPSPSKPISESEYCEMTRQILTESVSTHLVSDVPLGVFLSGGLDSSTIVALMANLSSAPIKTFSIGFGEEAQSYNELEHARRIAKHFGTDHHEYTLQPDIIDILPKLVWHLDEPFADSSMIPTYLVSKAAREHVTVALTGIGGDEIFGGYPRYLGARLGVGYEKMPEWIRGAMARAVSLLPESTQSRNLSGWAKRFVRGGLLPSRERYLSWISFANEEVLRGLLTESLRQELENTDIWAHHRFVYENNNAQDLMDKILYLDVKTYLADDLLMMGDKMSMANSLELRVPFCDHKLVEYAASVPSKIKYSGQNLKSLLKKSVKDLLPREIIQRKKQGFMVPVAQWFQKELRGFTLDLLSRENIRKRGFFEADYVHGLLDRHFTGKQNLTDQIFALVTLEVWCRIYLDGRGY